MFDPSGGDNRKLSKKTSERFVLTKVKHKSGLQLAQANKGIFAGWFVILLFMEVVWEALEIASETEGLALANTVTEQAQILFQKTKLLNTFV